jgi:hypothetical protein
MRPPIDISSTIMALLDFGKPKELLIRKFNRIFRVP